MRRYKAKRVKTRSLEEWVGHFEPKFQGKRSSLGNIFLVSTKLDTFCYPTVQNCTALRAVVLTQYRRVSDGRTDGIAVANTALAMRSLRAL